ncbi:putative transporter [Pseudocercospora fuligena]|uniref:Putative transporter n=1 Tax=Pseudocercospora fuligena TaxID=685502 RepID=A0A8H6RIQ6_9PEZI|nr:putative transporter [Pseudocercospora fuligena]
MTDKAAESVTVERVDTIQPARTPSTPITDAAAIFLKQAEASGRVTLSADEEKAVRRKVDGRILPIILAAYFFQQLDKSTLSYTSVFGIVQDAHLVGKQYSWLGSILYLAQLVAQPIAALTLVKLPTGKVIASAVFLWGSTLCIMSACTNFRSLLALRFMLGVFESLIAPSCIAVTQMWWRRGEQTLRTMSWTSMNGVTLIVGSLFTYGLGHIQSKALFPYQIIFLFCGLLTVVYSISVFIWMPDSPMTAKFLTEPEKIVAVERLRSNQMGIVTRKWRWDHVFEVFYDLKTYCWFFIVAAVSIPSGGMGTFGSLIIKSFGYNKFQTILFNLPFGAMTIIVTLGGGWLATKLRSKGLVIALLCVPTIAGIIVMLKIPHTPGNRGVLLTGWYLTSLFPGITPLLYAWQAQNTAGDTKRKCTTGVLIVGMCTGNVIGPLMYSPSQAPLYRKGLLSSLSMFILVAILAGLICMYLNLLNVYHGRRREELGKPRDLVDRSMQKVRGEEILDEVENDLALHDTTDLKNEDFIYVL